MTKVQSDIEAWAEGMHSDDTRSLLAETLLARSLIIADLLPEESLDEPARLMKRAWTQVHRPRLDVPTAYILSNYGNNLRRAKRLREAVKIFEIVLKTHPEKDERVSAAMLLAKASSTLKDVGKFKEAVEFAREHLDLCEPGTALTNDFALTEIEARGLLQVGEPAEALRVLSRRSGSGELLASPQWRIIFAVTQGEALAANGQIAEGAARMADAVEAAAAIGLPHQLQRVRRICEAYETVEMKQTVELVDRNQARSIATNLLK